MGTSVSHVSGDAQRVIDVRNLWKVFGSGSPDTAIARAQAGESRADILASSGQTVAVRDVSFHVGHGETFVVMGLSGSGKSTLIRCLSRLVEPTRGEVRLNGTDLLAMDEESLRGVRRGQMSMVFQHFGLFPHRKVIDNIAYGLEVQGIDKDARRARATEVLGIVGLDGWADHYPQQLSGGMQQRVGLARALAVDPSPWLDAVGGADSATTLAQEEPAHLNIWDLRNRAKSGSERRAWLPLVLAALVIVSAFIYFARANSATQELLPAETVSPSASATPTETAAPTATTTPAESAMPSATATPEQVIEQPVTGAVQFTLTCVSASWVRITNALGTIYEGTMQPGETRDVVSDSEVFVRVGNAAGMQLEYNGRFFPTLGNPGEVYSHTFRVL